MEGLESSLLDKLNAISGQNKLKQKGKIYFHSCFRSNRCIWLLRELNALDDFELIDVDVWDKASKDCTEYTERVHPHTTVPALECDNTIILESGAICMYLAEKYKKLIPQSLIEYHNVMFYVCSTFDEVLERLFIQFFFKEPHGQEDKNEIEHASQKFHICAKYLTSLLGRKDYICSDGFSVADCVLGYSIWWASEMKDGILLKQYPELTHYLNRLKNRPAFKKTWTTS